MMKETGGGKAKLTYFHPTICPQQQQNMSSTVCVPEIINLST
jgi:hypothetical protein